MSTIVTWADDAGAIVTVIFDIDEQETHDLQNVITENPVEDLKDVTDHIRAQLDRFTLQGFVSDSPLWSNRAVVGDPNQDFGAFVEIELQVPDYPIQIGEAGLIEAGIGALGNAIFGKPKTKATLLKFDNFKSRKRAMFALWKDARDKGRLCRVITSLHEYENMGVEQITVTRSPADGNGAVFTINVKELQFVTSETVDAPEPAEVSGAASESAGSQNTGDVTGAKSDANDTAAKKIFDALSGALGKVFG